MPIEPFSKFPEYRVYRAMLDRCYNPNAAGFKNYGGRGIKVCKRWLDSFQNFYADMGPRPTPKHSIDRRKNWLGYSARNCHWATWDEQANNTRLTIKLRLNGVTKTISDWAKETGLPRSVIAARYYAGWSPRKILSTPKTREYRRAKLITIGNETLTALEWARRSGIPKHVIALRHAEGWPADKLLVPIGSTRRSEGPRCPCGKNTVKAATIYRFNCCKRAGVIPWSRAPRPRATQGASA